MDNISIPQTQQNISNGSELNQTNNELKNSPNNVDLPKKTILSKKALIIIIISSIILIAIVLTLVLILTTRNNRKTKTFIIPNNQTEEEETENMTSQISTTDLVENITVISYEEAEILIGSENTKKTHELLNKSSNDLEELISSIDNATANFTLLNIAIGELPENLDFLKNTTDSTLLVAKEDLNLYMESFSAIPEQINNLTKEMTKMMKKISDSLIQYKKDIDNMNKQYEENIRYLAMPLLSNSTNLRNLEKGGLIEKYKEELD